MIGCRSSILECIDVALRILDLALQSSMFGRGLLRLLQRVSQFPGKTDRGIGSGTSKPLPDTLDGFRELVGIALDPRNLTLETCAFGDLAAEFGQGFERVLDRRACNCAFPVYFGN